LLSAQKLGFRENEGEQWMSFGQETFWACLAIGYELKTLLQRFDLCSQIHEGKTTKYNVHFGW